MIKRQHEGEGEDGDAMNEARCVLGEVALMPCRKLGLESCVYLLGWRLVLTPLFGMEKNVIKMA